LCQIRRQPETPALARWVIFTAASRLGLSSLVLQVAVDVQRLVELGKTYPWPKLTRCLSCNSSRIWGHGYVARYFEGFLLPAWVRRLRCPDCGTVYTLRPDVFYQRFRYPVRTILSSLHSKITGLCWLPSIPRQNQQYWLSGLKLQIMRLQNVLQLSVDILKDVILSGLIPSSHSFNCAILRR
jgi:hypothetical protein